LLHDPTIDPDHIKLIEVVERGLLREIPVRIFDIE